MVKQEIFWQTTVAMPGAEPLTPLPEKVDVAVIGGGFTGLSAARTLAKNGASVAVLDAETMGWGASSRNGGMSLTGLKIALQTAIKRYGKEHARKLFQCSLDSIDTIKQHPFAQFNFPGAPLGLYDGQPWFLPFAGMWHKILDWVE